MKKKELQNMTKSFVYFWESITDKRAAKERANYVLKPIKKYNKKAKKVLELGVGIGAVLINFPKRFDVYGLDIEKEYVDICRKKIKRGKFFVASMSNFKINERFDAIFSVYDSINYLKTFAQWKSTFKSVSDHLLEDGLFIFDMETPKLLKYYKGKPAAAGKFSKGYVYDGAIFKNNTVTWDFKVFEKLKNGLYQIHEYKFKEIIHPVPKVKSALSKQFEILETKLMGEGKTILFVCRKK